MKRHLKSIAGGGVVAPTALVIATAIANLGQSLVGLDLHGTGLALYCAAFLLGVAAVMHGQLRLEAQKLLAELGNGGLDLGGLLGSLGDVFGAQEPTGPTTSPATPAPPAAPAAVTPPPPPPAS